MFSLVRENSRPNGSARLSLAVEKERGGGDGPLLESTCAMVNSFPFFSNIERVGKLQSGSLACLADFDPKSGENFTRRL